MNKFTEEEKRQILRLVDKAEEYFFKYVSFCESLKQRIHSLEAENESLRKSALVWHELEHLDEPDENGYIVHGNPAEEGKDYLLKFDFGYDVDTLDEDGDGFFFPAHDWSEIEAWAELPEVGK